MSERFARLDRLRRATAIVTLVALNLAPMIPPAASTAAADGPKTVTPIKHLIVIIGENRTFDNVYATYEPHHPHTVSNLLSKGIVKRDGSPGPNKDLAEQFQIGTISPVSYFISTDKLLNPNKTGYVPFLPTPEAGGAPPRAVTLQQLDKDPVPSAPP